MRSAPSHRPPRDPQPQVFPRRHCILSPRSVPCKSICVVSGLPPVLPTRSRLSILRFGSFFCTAAPSHLDSILSLSLTCCRMCPVSDLLSSPPRTPHTALTSHDILAYYSHPTYECRPLTFNYPSPLKTALGTGILVYAARSACTRAGALTYLR